MLSEKQLSEIREHLEKAQNPLFFFDNDVDGLCSFILLRRSIGRGRGVVIKSFPELNGGYKRKVDELKPDYVFILDKPLVAKEFLQEMRDRNLPIVWIDHHDVPPPDSLDNLYYYNPISSGNSEPTTYLCYRALPREEDLWLAVIGCISDGYFPDFFGKFREKYPDFANDTTSAFQCLYNSKIGEIARILGFALKDKTSNVINMIRFLFRVKSPNDILVESRENAQILERFKRIDEKYTKLIEKAKLYAKKEKLLYFQYGGDLSISADISNELIYRNPDKVVVVAYIKGAKANVSIRGKDDVREMTLQSIKDIPGATGGGHKQATGAQIPVEDLPRFRENMVKAMMEKGLR